jgi:hypothetical protein
MKLTKKEKQLCIDKWQWFYDHPKCYSLDDLPENLRHRFVNNECFLCEYYLSTDCTHCPVYVTERSTCFENNSFAKWTLANTSQFRKICAGKLLEIMKSL